jgi:hypothetical protein
MSSISKFFKPLMAACFALALFSCNNGGDKQEEKKPATADSSTAVAFKPFKLMIIQHKVANFGKWEEGYLAHDSMRLSFGISKYRLGRGMEDSNMVIAIDIINDVQKAKEFAGSADLKAAMQKAGVMGAPTISYLEVIRNDSSKIDQTDRVLVSHKVKDFDTWLKAYDAEGKAKRMENGLIDRAIGRGTDDPNMVYIAFAISDMAKAKARMGSDELKKIMTDAGVEGPPTVFMYKVVQ